jgi:hypothetical protein
MSDKSALVSYSAQAAGLTYGFVTMEVVVGGIAIFLGIATYATTYYFQKQRNKREQEIHILQINALKRDANGNLKVSK